jgi:hypothetical protein
MSTLNSAKQLQFLDILVAPRDFFARFDQTRKYGPIVLVAVLAMVILSNHLFYSNMSDEWLLEQQLLQVGEMTAAERDVIEGVMKKNLPSAGLFVGVMSAVGILLQVLVLSGFYALASILLRPGSRRLAYKDWFNLVGWCQAPWLIHHAMFIFLFLSAPSADLPLSLAYFSSIGQIFLDLPSSHRYYTLLQSISLFHLWVIFMTAVAISQHAGTSMSRALALSASPYLLFFSIWVALI